MKNIIVCGAGRIGKAIALDLSEKHSVLAIDHDQRALNELANKSESIRVIHTDISDRTNIENNIKDANLVISAVPGYLGFETLKTIIQCGKNVVDIAFFPENALELDSLAKQHHVTAIVDMGVAPGLSNLLLGYHNQELNIESFNCMVGGLPKHPKPPFNYKAPFSPIDVIEEYTRPAHLVRNGEHITLPALSEIETVEFMNVGTLEAFNTDGLRTLIKSFPDIPNMVEKTLRYPGHAALIQTLKDIGYLDKTLATNPDNLSNPLDLSTLLLKKHWQLEEKEPEFTIMRVKISGQPKSNSDADNFNLNKFVSHQYDLYDEYDIATDTSSMARTTGYTCTAAVNLVLNNIYDVKGISAPENIGQKPECFKFIMDYLKKRRITINQVKNDSTVDKDTDKQQQ